MQDDARNLFNGGNEPTQNAGNFIRFDSAQNYPLSYIVINRDWFSSVHPNEGSSYPQQVQISSAQIVLESATNLYLRQGTGADVAWYDNGGVERNNARLQNYEIASDDDDVNELGFFRTVSLDASYSNCLLLSSGTRYLAFNNQNDWKLQAATTHVDSHIYYSGGATIGGGTSPSLERTYTLNVNGTIGASGNITAFADYVCNSCGWYSAAETKKCPNCGSKDVHYHDDIELLRQIVDAQSMYPHDAEKQYRAYEKLAKLGVVDLVVGAENMVGEKDWKIVQNITRMNSYLISSIVQERKQSDKLSERVDKLETIIEEFGYEPRKTKGLNNNKSFKVEDDNRFLFHRVKKGWQFDGRPWVDKIKKKIWSFKKDKD